VQALERRLATLEKAQPQAERVIFIILVGMGQVDMEVTHIYDNNGNHWNRQSDETDAAFKARATSEAPRKANQTVMLFGDMA
jgi:hypothetical protein